jgi:hypothetical protein
LPAEEAVSRAIKATAGVVTSAAVVMVAVFSIFATLSALVFKQFGVALAVAILVDATIVRAVLLPSAMSLLGSRGWYLPRWLEWLPSYGSVITEKTAPSGSSSTAIRPTDESNAGTATRPAELLGAGARAVGVRDGEVDPPVRRQVRGPLLAGHRHHAADPALRLGVALTRQMPAGVLAALERHGRGAPAEDLAVEALGAVRVARQQLVPAHRARLVDEARSDVLPGLPDAERRTRAVGEHRHPPRVEDVEGLGEHPAAGVRHLRGGRVGVVDRDVGGPHDRPGAHLARQRRDVAPRARAP